MAEGDVSVAHDLMALRIATTVARLVILHVTVPMNRLLTKCGRPSRRKGIRTDVVSIVEGQFVETSTRLQKILVF